MTIIAFYNILALIILSLALINEQFKKDPSEKRAQTGCSGKRAGCIQADCLFLGEQEMLSKKKEPQGPDGTVRCRKRGIGLLKTCCFS